MPRTLTVYRPGLVGYNGALAAQKRLVDDFVRRPRDAGALVLLQHPPVITIGRRGTEENILVDTEELGRAGVAVCETNRGGDVTYHGPGQIVGYPILPLEHHGKDIHAYLRRLETLLIAALWEYGIKAEQRAGLTGVWTAQGKIASIGVAITHWVSWHGFALNVAPNLAHFGLIHPCGLRGVQIASMERIMGQAPDYAEVEERVIRHLAAEFEFTETETGDCSDVFLPQKPTTDEH